MLRDAEAGPFYPRHRPAARYPRRRLCDTRVMRRFLPLFAVCLLSGCDREPPWTGSLEQFLRAQPQRFGKVMADPARHRVQVIYTRIDRDASNRPTFRSYTYRVDPSEYFYPASTVKLPTAALALEKLNRLAIPGLDRDTPMLTGAAAEFQTAAVVDPTSPDGLPSVGHYIRKILLVSDNDAFNRLYEFIGQRELNEALAAKGYRHTRIVHRLEIALTPEQNRLTNPVRFVRNGRTVYEQPAAASEVDYLGERPEPLGRAEIIDGVRREAPKDFAEKNSYALQDLHDTVLALMFPDSVPAARRFDLTPEDYRFLYRQMSAYAGESGIEAYADAAEYPPGFVKFLMYGGDAEAIPAHIRIFNKVGDAYGFLTDAAYIVDFEHGVEFLLAATVYVNDNETFNDDEYEYEEIGLPFLRELGRAIYELELGRRRPDPPDLDRFRFPDRAY